MSCDDQHYIMDMDMDIFMNIPYMNIPYLLDKSKRFGCYCAHGRIKPENGLVHVWMSSSVWESIKLSLLSRWQSLNNHLSMLISWYFCTFQIQCMVSIVSPTCQMQMFMDVKIFDVPKMTFLHFDANHPKSNHN